MSPQERKNLRLAVAQAKANMLAWFMHGLYGKLDIERHVGLQSLITRNCVAIGGVDLCFKHRGHIYRYDANEVPSTMPELHPMLVAEVDAHLAKFHDIMEIEKPIVRGYLNAVLNASDNPIFYYEAVPVKLHEYLDRFHAAFCFVKEPPSPEKMEAFFKKHASPRNLMKQRLLIDYLTTEQ